MFDKSPYQEPPKEAEGAEKPLNARWEFFKFISILALLTAIAVGNLFYRGMPLVELRRYDFTSPFVFRNIYHNGEVSFKACFQQKLAGYFGYFVCHKFPPSKLQIPDGEFSSQQFSTLFIDKEYLGKFIAKFQEKRWDLGKDFFGFRIEHKPADLTITPIFVPLGQGARYSMAQNHY